MKIKYNIYKVDVIEAEMHVDPKGRLLDGNWKTTETRKHVKDYQVYRCVFVVHKEE